jgi:hypothetical protein
MEQTPQPALAAVSIEAGRDGGRPKLVTDDIASDIRARKAAGESFRSIANSVGFSVATVQNVLKSVARGSIVHGCR